MVVTDSTARLPPCRPRITETMSCLPVAPSAMRIATSLASEPVTVKFTMLSSSGSVAVMRSANAISAGLANHDD